MVHSQWLRVYQMNEWGLQMKSMDDRLSRRSKRLIKQTILLVFSQKPGPWFTPKPETHSTLRVTVVRRSLLYSLELNTNEHLTLVTVTDTRSSHLEIACKKRWGWRRRRWRSARESSLSTLSESERIKAIHLPKVNPREKWNSVTHHINQDRSVNNKPKSLLLKWILFSSLISSIEVVSLILVQSIGCSSHAMQRKSITNVNAIRGGKEKRREPESGKSLWCHWLWASFVT